MSFFSSSFNISVAFTCMEPYLFRLCRICSACTGGYSMGVGNTDMLYSTLGKVVHAIVVTCAERRPVHSVRLSRGRHPHILTCAMWLMGKSCVQRRPVAGHSNGERICVKVCVIVSVESGACVCSVHTANVAVRSGADMHARLKFNNRGATATKIRPYSSLHNSHTAQQAVVFSTRPFTRSSNRHLPISHV